MSLYYYKSDVGNIGDDINAWLWQDLLELERVRKDTKLIGFGSILTSKLNEIIDDRTIKQKIVLGAGVRSIDVLPKVDATWDLSFLRGPISSVFLTNSLDNYITDGAYALWLHRRFDDLQKEEKKFEISFMPYLRTSSLMPWQKICDAVGIHLISPHPARGVESTLREIAASKCVITEAMHGAILSDILNVPWAKMQFAADLFEGSVNESKWQDWSRSLDIKYNTYRTLKLPKKVSQLPPQLYKRYIKFRSWSLRKEVEAQLKTIMKNEDFTKSKDGKRSEVKERLQAKVDDIKRKIY
jgi:hypothetical protein